MEISATTFHHLESG